jgi:hypothetical protein
MSLGLLLLIKMHPKDSSICYEIILLMSVQLEKTDYIFSKSKQGRKILLVVAEMVLTLDKL